MAQTLTEEEKAERARQRMLAKAAEYQLSTYANRFVAQVFQRMIRAEAAAKPAGTVTAVVKGELAQVPRRVGECVCVTCGKVRQWRDSRGSMQTGHFLASRCFSILFNEENVAPQCVRCNNYRSGAVEDYHIWMVAERGRSAMERLKRLKATTRHFTREELVDMRIGFDARLSEAITRMTR